MYVDDCNDLKLLLHPPRCHFYALYLEIELWPWPSIPTISRSTLMPHTKVCRLVKLFGYESTHRHTETLSIILPFLLKWEMNIPTCGLYLRGPEATLIYASAVRHVSQVTTLATVRTNIKVLNNTVITNSTIPVTDNFWPPLCKKNTICDG